jgi:O-antigen ligase
LGLSSFFSRGRYSESALTAGLVFLFPIFFLTLKGWTNAISFLIFFVAVFHIVRNINFYVGSREKNFWWVFGILGAPFLCSLISQLGRGDIVVSSLDGPARFLMAAIAFIYLSRTKVNYVQLLANGCCLAVLATAISIFLFKDYYWGNRAATYFVDPITLPCFLIACLALTGFHRLHRIQSIWVIFGSCILIVITGYVVLESQSRTSMVAFLGLVLAELYIVFRFKDKSAVIVSVAIFFLTISGGLYFSDVVINRMSEAVRGVELFFSGYADTSTGTRLGLARMDLLLFVNNPFFGVADASLPPIEWFWERGININQALYEQKMLSGSHNELLARLVREGLFGLFALISLFVFPIFVFHRFSSSGSPQAVTAARIGWVFCIVIFLSGLTIQVFNLKMTSTFFAFIISLLFSQIFCSLSPGFEKNTA